MLFVYFVFVFEAKTRLFRLLPVTKIYPSNQLQPAPIISGRNVKSLF